MRAENLKVNRDLALDADGKPIFLEDRYRELETQLAQLRKDQVEKAKEVSDEMKAILLNIAEPEGRHPYFSQKAVKLERLLFSRFGIGEFAENAAKIKEGQSW